MTVFPLGLGCMGLHGAYGPLAESDAEQLLSVALDHGIDLLDTGDFYGGGRNEELIGRCLGTGQRKVKVATKTGIAMSPDRTPILKGRPEQVIAACEASLRRLRRDQIDLFLLARIDPEVPVEDTVGAMAQLVAQGKVAHIGLSEASSATIRRAHSVHPLAVLETEYSLAERGVEADILPTLRALGISLIAYSPLGRGLLTASLPPNAVFDGGDFRRANPRFSADALPANLRKAAKLSEVAQQLGATAAQVALAWLLAQGPEVIPVFGTRASDRLLANIDAAGLRLPSEIVEKLSQAFPNGWAQGNRYPDAQMQLIEA